MGSEHTDPVEEQELRHLKSEEVCDLWLQYPFTINAETTELFINPFIIGTHHCHAWPWLWINLPSGILIENQAAMGKVVFLHYQR